MAKHTRFSPKYQHDVNLEKLLARKCYEEAYRLITKNVHSFRYSSVLTARTLAFLGHWDELFELSFGRVTGSEDEETSYSYLYYIVACYAMKQDPLQRAVKDTSIQDRLLAYKRLTDITSPYLELISILASAKPEWQVIRNSDNILNCLPRHASLLKRSELYLSSSHEASVNLVYRIVQDGGIACRNPAILTENLFASETASQNLFLYIDTQRPYALYLEFSHHPPFIGKPVILSFFDRKAYTMSCGVRFAITENFIAGILEHSLVSAVNFWGMRRASGVTLSLGNNHISHGLFNRCSFAHDIISMMNNSERSVSIRLEWPTAEKSHWPVRELFDDLDQSGSDNCLETAPTKITLSPEGHFVSQSLRSRIIELAHEHIGIPKSNVILAKLNRLKSCYPIIMFSLRASSGGVVRQERHQPPNQLEAFKLLIGKLKPLFPSLGVVIDGAIAPWNSSIDTIDVNIADTLQDYASSLNDSLDCSGVSSFSLIGRPMPLAIVVDQLVDLFICPLGSGLTRYVWLSQLNGIVYASWETLSMGNQRIWQGESKSGHASTYSDSSSKLSYLLNTDRCFDLDVDSLAKEVLSLLPHSTRCSAYPFP